MDTHDQHESFIKTPQQLVVVILLAFTVPIFGIIRQDKLLGLPERHLGLVLAQEIEGIEAFMNHAADVISETCDLDALVALSRRAGETTARPDCLVPPLGSHIAIARDQAFAFTYPHLMQGWQAEGASLSFFSPLADEPPDAAADSVFLPGGYPELHAGRLSAAAAQTRFCGLNIRNAYNRHKRTTNRAGTTIS